MPHSVTITRNELKEATFSLMIELFSKREVHMLEAQGFKNYEQYLYPRRFRAILY